jgi:NAD(P)H dehydrogenase (quinone)
MLKGFIDRVFSNGYAYIYGEGGPKGLLVDKTVQLFINTGNPSEILSKSGMHAAIEKALIEGVFGFCGMKAELTFFGNVALCSNEDRLQYLNNIRDIIR